MHLFVYGTLRRAAARPIHQMLQPAVFVGYARLQGQLYDLGQYPGAILSADPADQVHGEIYLLETPAETLAALDRYEGCDPASAAPHEYVRVTVPLHLEPDDRAISAQAYLYNRPIDTLPRIRPGDWLARQASGRADAPEKQTLPANSIEV